MPDLLGAHMSIAGGLHRALWRGRDVDRRFRHVPMAIETPKEPEPRADRQGPKLLRSLRSADG